MSNKDMLAKKRGFYVALFTCVGVLMAIGASVAFNNYRAAERASEAQAQLETESVDFSEMAQTSVSQTKPYLAPSDRNEPTTTPVPSGTEQSLDIQEEDIAKRPTEIKKQPDEAEKQPNEAEKQPSEAGKQPSEAEKQPSEAEKQPAQTDKSLTETEKQPVDNSKEKTNNNTQPSAAKPQETPAVTEIPTAPAKSSRAETTEDEPITVEIVEVEPVFNEYTDDRKMSWPVLGELVRNFSIAHLIYDKTLDQYRTTDSICIAAEVGSQVKASAAGKVSDIRETREHGNQVVVDHGNGWSTTYSQLQDGVLVKIGDIVQEGQVIGGVGNPSIYSLLLGNHLEFKVANGELPVDPIEILVN